MDQQPPQPDAPANAAAVTAQRKQRGGLVRGTLRIVRVLVGSVLAFVAIVVFTPLGDRFGSDLVQIDPIEGADYIVVLGGDHARAVEAARLYRDGWSRKVIVTSSGEAADDLARAVIEYGVPSKDVLIDRSSMRTADHPAAVSRLTGVNKKSQRFILLTSAYHTARAKACFLHDGYTNVVLRTPDWELFGQLAPQTPPRWQDRLRYLPSKFHEIIGIRYYQARGWM